MPENEKVKRNSSTLKPNMKKENENQYFEDNVHDGEAEEGKTKLSFAAGPKIKRVGRAILVGPCRGNSSPLLGGGGQEDVIPGISYTRGGKEIMLLRTDHKGPITDHETAKGKI